MYRNIRNGSIQYWCTNGLHISDESGTAVKHTCTRHITTKPKQAPGTYVRKAHDVTTTVPQYNDRIYSMLMYERTVYFEREWYCCKTYQAHNHQNETSTRHVRGYGRLTASRVHLRVATNSRGTWRLARNRSGKTTTTPIHIIYMYIMYLSNNRAIAIYQNSFGLKNM